MKVAATLTAERGHEFDGFRAFLESMSIPREDQLIRTLAKRGFASEGSN